MSFDKDPFLSEVPQKKLAVLIDADNAQPEIIEGLLAEIALYGIASVKRIYGNWTTPNLQPWKEVLLSYSIQPIQQFDYTKGKNATDSALIIDAMDLLYTDKFDGFCIVSSDSDFTRLAQRIRESGLLVYGFGERKTPKPFVQACDKFVYTEILRKTRLADEQPPETQKEPKPGKSPDQLRGDTGLSNLLRPQWMHVPITMAGQTLQMWGEILPTSPRILIPVTTGIKNSRLLWKRPTFLRWMRR